MESDPHRLLEGMAIAGYAVGADQGYIYVRGEYPIAAQRLQRAIRAAERRGILGSRVLDSNFTFRVDVRIGAGAFVCGEETALMASIMGRRGQPVPRPPYPAERGLWGKPTLINNVETFGNIAPIIFNGAEWFAGIGTEKSKGTKIFALAGNVDTTGLIEVPMGITLREIVYDIGGGIPDGYAFKAAQTGGPSGGCIPAQYLDTPVDYESLGALGSIMGSGGLSSWTSAAAWRTSPSTSSSSVWTRAAASACPAAWARCRCTASWSASRTAAPTLTTWRCWKSYAPWCARPASAGWGRTRPTP